MIWDDLYLYYTVGATVLTVFYAGKINAWPNQLTALLIAWGWFVLANATYTPGEIEALPTALIGILVAVRWGLRHRLAAQDHDIVWHLSCLLVYC